MLEISVYYHDVLRYKVIADWGKVQQLQNSGFDVQVKEAPGQGLGLGRPHTSRLAPGNGEGDVIVRHDGDTVRDQSQARSDIENQTSVYY